MKTTSRNLVRKGFLVLAIIGMILFALSSLAPFINAGTYWYVALTGLVFPWLFIAMLLSLVILSIQKSKLSFVVLGLLLLSWPALSVTLGRNFSQSEAAPKSDTSYLRVLSWNVFRWDEMRKHTPDQPGNRENMLDAVEGENADILVFHEFYEPTGNALKNFKPNIAAIQAMGYPYYYFFPTSVIHTGTKHFGMAIFSRYPIVDSASTRFGKTVHSEGLMYVDVRVRDKRLRIFSTHLESFKIGKSDYYGDDQSGLMASARTSLASVRNAYNVRVQQAEIVRDALHGSPHPVVLCGNLGDVPASNTYRLIKGEYKDAFVEKGSAFGKTFRHVLPNLRLDYILTDDKIKIDRFRTSDFGHSDHFALVADISLP